MSSAEPGARPGAISPADVEGWLSALGLTPTERADRDGIAAWDLVLDGRRRFDLRVTVILDPGLGVICWAQYAPPISDMFRKSYRRLLRWNDEFPFAKFSLAEDERPILTVEIAPVLAGRDALGLAIARSLAIADQLLEESAGWLWIGGRIPDTSGRTSRGEALLERYRAELGELAGEPRPDATEPGEVAPAATPPAGATPPASPATDSPADLAPAAADR